MSDPIETSQPEIIARILGALTLVLGAIAGLWRTIFGSKAERADALERAAEIALRNAEHADEQSAVYKRERLTCEEQLSEMRAEIRLMRADLDALRAENVHLRREQEIARGMLSDLMRNASTPPSGLHVPDDVRAALAQEDHDHG